MIRIAVVCGPTASRKSELGMGIAETLNGELVGCDSVQIYRGFRIGTAGPTDSDLQRLPHHLYDELEWDDPCDAGRYARLADAAIHDIERRGKLPVIVGGTGLYLRALLHGLVEVPSIPPDVRSKLAAELETLGKEAMYEKLRSVDPVLAEKIEGGAANSQRTLRGLEVYEATGIRLSDLQAKHKPTPARYDATLFMPTFDTNVLNERISARVDHMVSIGLVEEVKGLLAQGVSPDCRPMQALGYRQIAAHLNGQYTLEEAIEDVRAGHRKYAKRQRTWFRGSEGLHCLDGLQDDLVRNATNILNSSFSS